MSLTESSPLFPSTQPHIAGSLASLFDISEGVHGFGVGCISNWTSTALKSPKVGVGRICRKESPSLMRRRKYRKMEKSCRVKAVMV